MKPETLTLLIPIIAITGSCIVVSVFFYSLFKYLTFRKGVNQIPGGSQGDPIGDVQCKSNERLSGINFGSVITPCAVFAYLVAIIADTGPAIAASISICTMGALVCIIQILKK